MDIGPPLVLTALGLILWLAIDATLAGISIHTIGITGRWSASSGC